MNTQHTPGPWTIEDAGESDIKGEKYWDCEIRVPHRASIVRLMDSHHCEEFGFSAEETQANARLIAAAPDLLAALEEIYREFGDMGGPEGWSESVMKARAAIAKAKGEK